MSTDASLLQHLDTSQLVCLNEAKGHTAISILSEKKRNTSGSYLLSDADEQLLLSVPFHQTVKVKFLVLRCQTAPQGPKKIKLLVNKADVTFEDVEDAEEPEVAQILELTEEQVSNGVPIPLRFVRFQSVTSLQIFVVSNQGDQEQTRIDAIDFLGVAVENGTRDLSGLGKQNE